MTNASSPRPHYSTLVAEIATLLEEGRKKAGQAVNTVLVQTYWAIGKYIVEFEQGGKSHSLYGAKLLDQLSYDLSLRYGKGFSRSNLIYIRKLYLTFPIGETLSHQLTWSHYFEILKIEQPLEASFYIKQCKKERWSVRELKRQMNTMLFHRLALSKDKEGVLELAHKGLEITTGEDIIKDPYILEFLDIKQGQTVSEEKLEKKLIDSLQMFLLELGKGFTFVGRQYRLSIAGKHYYVDLVFYHRILKCFVLIDLKLGEIEHNDIGQMNFYLNYFRKEENALDDNEPIGIVLGSKKDEIVVEYATHNVNNQLFVSKYQLYLPDKASLQRQLNVLLGEHSP